LLPKPTPSPSLFFSWRIICIITFYCYTQSQTTEVYISNKFVTISWYHGCLPDTPRHSGNSVLLYGYIIPTVRNHINRACTYIPSIYSIYPSSEIFYFSQQFFNKNSWSSWSFPPRKSPQSDSYKHKFRIPASYSSQESWTTTKLFHVAFHKSEYCMWCISIYHCEIDNFSLIFIYFIFS